MGFRVSHVMNWGFGWIGTVLLDSCLKA